MAKTEDIEAKLAAYVDGELDAAGRAQIEQHLIDHPQHRTLIQDLMQQKQLVASLPRISAPPEVAETFNAQLERAVLLGDVDGGADAGPVLRIGFSSQIRAIAAMLFLTAGLGGLIWYLLPKGDRTPQLADVRMPASALPEAAAPTSNPMGMALATEKDFDDVVAGLRAADAEKRALADQAPALDGPREAIAMGGGAGRGGRGGGGGMGGGAGAINNDIGTMPLAVAAPEPTGNRDNAADQPSNLFDSLKLGPPAPTSEMTYIFATDNPNFANQQVTSYLTSNGITWQNESEPMPQPLNLAQSQTGFASRDMRQEVAMKSAAPQTRTMDQVAQQQGAAATSNRIIARQVPRSRAMEVVADLNKIQNQAKQEPFSFQNRAVSAQASQQQQFKDASELSRLVARADGLMESNVGPRGGIDAAALPSQPPATMPFTGANFAPTIAPPPGAKTDEIIAGAPATQPVQDQTLQKEQSRIGLSANALPPQDLVDVVIVVQTGEAAPIPSTQP